MNRVGKIVLNNEIKSLKKEVEKLKSNGVEFIIALGHSGLEMDRQVAREVDGVDVVVGGHSHTYLITGKSTYTSTIISLCFELNIYVLYHSRVKTNISVLYIFKIT